MMLEKSCGTIPFTVKNGEIRYLLIRAKDDGYCGFPKGHVEGKETEEETALRETWEETSTRPTILGGFRREIQYRMGNGNVKKVVYFTADFQDQVPHHNNGFEWVDYWILPFDEACRALSFENTVTLLEQADAYIKTYLKNKNTAE